MSSYDKDPLAAAKQAERELNSHQAKQGGYNNSDSGMFEFLLAVLLYQSWLNILLLVCLLTSFGYMPSSDPSYLTNPSPANESGVNESVENRFPGAKVTYGSAASGAGDNREIPVEEGGDILKSGQPTKARDFEGVGGPEDKSELGRIERGGDDDVNGNVRQGGVRDGAVRNS